MQIQPLKFLATGVSSSARAVSSAFLDELNGLPAGTIESKSGIQSRGVAPTSLLQSEFAASAVRAALTRGDLRESSIDLLLSVSGVQQQALPSTACAVARHLSLRPGAPAFDVNASCLGFLAGLQVASSLLAARQYRRIAIVASDMPSRGVDWNEPEASWIFGDGAAAAIVEAGDGSTGIRSLMLETRPEGFEHCEVRAGGTRRNPRAGDEPRDYLFRMNGKAVFKLALQTMPSLLAKVIADSGTSLSDITAVVPHQASNLAMAHAVSRLGFEASKVVNIYPSHGNQVAASLPSALHHALDTGMLPRGSRGLLLGTAAGFTAGAAVLQF